MRRTVPILAIAVAAATPVMVAAQFFLAQPQEGTPVDPNLRFEVASIKAADTSSGGTRIMMTPGRLEVTNAPVRILVTQALRMPADRIIGLPAWVDSDRYSIAAKAPEGTPQPALPVMTANLLKDRFNLVTHTETRELPVFNLVFSRADQRLGSALKESNAECQAMIAARRGGGGRAAGDAPGRGGLPLVGRAGGPPPFDMSAPAPCGSMRIGPGIAGGGGQPFTQIAQLLTQFAGRPVIDKSGLTGLYDYTLKWAPEPGTGGGPLGPLPPGAPLPAPDPDAANLFTAVQEQLGLKLESARSPLDVVIVDRIEKPTLD